MLESTAADSLSRVASLVIYAVEGTCTLVVCFLQGFDLVLVKPGEIQCSLDLRFEGFDLRWSGERW